MARIKYTAAIADIRGGIGGTAFSNSKHGKFIRTAASRRKTWSTNQQVNQTLFKRITATWRTLTEAQRAKWNIAALQDGKADIFGDIRYSKGFSLYTSRNFNLLLCSQAMLTVPALPQTIIIPTQLSIYLQQAPTTIFLDALPLVSGMNMSTLVYATKPISAGIKNFDYKFLLMSLYNSYANGRLDISAEYDAKYGRPRAGLQIAMKIVCINRTSGQASIPMVKSGIIIL